MASGYRFQYKGPIIGAELPSGELWMWGRNSYGQIGDNTIVNRSSPVQTISGGTNWSSVVTSFNSSAAIKSDGTLWCWGRGLSGQLGDNTTVNKSSPIQTIAGGTNWSSVALGYNFRGGIKTDGTLWMWGNNLSGQLGDNTTTNRSSPVQTITGGSNWSSISCGYGHTAATKTDGTLWLWGSQGYWIGATGALGDNTTTMRSSPIQTVAGGTNWSRVCAGYGATSAIKTDGTLWVWGNNFVGMLGTNDAVSRSSPVQTVTGGTNWSMVSITQNNAVALKTDNSLWVWGRGLEGQMGDNTAVSKSSPVQTGLNSKDWRDAWAGSSMVRALKNDGRIFTWGSAGGAGHLGDNANTARSNPTQITGSVFFKNVGEGSNSVHSGAVGNSFTTALVDLSDVYMEKFPFRANDYGTVYGFGQGSDGQLGTNNQIAVSSPTQIVSKDNIWVTVSAGYRHSAGVKSDGTLWCWGRNDSGQIGDNTTAHKSSPVQTITGGSNWRTVACGGTGFNGFTAAIKTDGTLWVWGANDSGQIADNTTINKSSPIQTITGGIDWRNISCGSAHIVSVKTDGTIWNWGLGTSGQLGDNTIASKSSPVQTITAGTTWLSASAGRNYTGGIKTDGTLWLWGANGNGQLGNNSTSSMSSPVQTIAAGTNWAQVACSRANNFIHSGAVKNDGTLWMWGGNLVGALGDNTSTSRSSPVQTVSLGTNWKSIAVNRYRCGAIKTDGTLWCWGFNTVGAVGDGTTTNRASPVQTVTKNNTWTQVSLGYDHTLAIVVVI